MRIAVASDDGVSVAGHFGRCREFIIFNIAENEATEIEKRLNSHGHRHDRGDCNQHGHDNSGHSHESFLIALHDCRVVICHGMGRRAIADLAAKGIKPAIITEDLSAHEAAKLYAVGRLNASGDSTCCSH